MTRQATANVALPRRAMRRASYLAYIQRGERARGEGSSRAQRCPSPLPAPRTVDRQSWTDRQRRSVRGDLQVGAGTGTLALVRYGSGRWDWSKASLCVLLVPATRSSVRERARHWRGWWVDARQATASPGRARPSGARWRAPVSTDEASGRGVEGVARARHRSYWPGVVTCRGLCGRPSRSGMRICRCVVNFGVRAALAGCLTGIHIAHSHC